jgi:hypothetical protein
MKITKRVVDAAKTGDRIVWDDDLQGFGLRVNKSGSRSYVVDYHVGGLRHRLTVCRADRLPPDEARSLAVQLLAKVAKGEDPAQERQQQRRSISVAELADLYIAEGPAAKPMKAERSWATDASNIRAHIKPLIGKKLAQAVTDSDVESFQRDVAAGKTRRDEKTRNGVGRSSKAAPESPPAACVCLARSIHSLSSGGSSLKIRVEASSSTRV